jgi:hypothetical protein
LTSTAVRDDQELGDPDPHRTAVVTCGALQHRYQSILIGTGQPRCPTAATGGNSSPESAPEPN